MSEDVLSVKVSFSFYPADMDALQERVRALKQAGVPVRGGTVLRALIQLSSSTEMIGHAVQMFATYAQKTGPREDEMVAGHPTVDLSEGQVKKLDEVVDQLSRRGLTTTRAFIVRAILRASPNGRELAPSVRKFLRDHPPRPSGWIARKARTARG